MVEVRIGFEGIGVDNLIRWYFASHDKGIPYDVPLAVRSEKVEQFPQIVHESSDLHPFWLAIFSHRLGGLEQVFDLCSVRVWIRGIDEGVEQLHGFPYPQSGSGLFKSLAPSFNVEFYSLLCVLFATCQYS